MKLNVFAVTALLLLPFMSVQAQIAADSTLPVIPYDKPAEYVIEGIRVTGSQYADANALIAIAGLRVGDKIRIPGQGITKAMQALWGLKLFTEVQINRERTIGDKIFLEILVKELPRYTRHSFTGVKKNKHDDLNNEISKHIQKGAILTDNARSTLVYSLEQYFVEKGYRNARVKIKTFPDEKATNAVRLEFIIDRGKRVKISDITFVGNENAKDRTLRKKMKGTTRTRKIFKKSKFVRSAFDEDKQAIENYYQTLGFRDAQVTGDSIWRTKKGKMMIQLNISEGNRYYFRNIDWKGNTIYETKYLNQVLGLKKGDVYNAELLNNRLTFSQDGRDISSLYLDNGYLFFRVDPVETSINGDSIDIELRMYEGPQATIDRVVIKGNDRTHEHVIRRELFTRPGDKFSRSDIIRSQREIINLGYFNQENLGINTPVNPERGTVDIEYTVEERPSDQLELSAGYQPRTFQGTRGGIIGTLGVTFNNFSLRNINNRESWNPLPQGDGQRFSIRGQTSGSFFQSYNASFTEPWLGGKKPNSLTVAGFYNKFSNAFANSSTSGSLTIAQATIGFGTRLKVPDDNFVFRADLDIQTLNIRNYGSFQDDRGQAANNGRFRNFNLGLTLARNSVNDPLFPRSGSTFSLKANLTPPYSLFTNKEKSYYDTLNANVLYKYVEYAKFRLDAEWYTTIVGKLVLKTSTKMGMVGRYNKNLPLSPFERFRVGGDGFNNQNFALQGFDLISSRGYDDYSSNSNGSGVMDAFPSNTYAGVFAKYTVELRYPVSLNPQSTIYVLGFAQGINAWRNVKEFNPFEVRRSAGLGLRVFLPMFGILGFDYGLGLDRPDLLNQPFKLTNYGNLNIVLGFEPD